MGVGGEQKFLLTTRNYCWLPTFFKFLEPCSRQWYLQLVKKIFLWLQESQWWCSRGSAKKCCNSQTNWCCEKTNCYWSWCDVWRNRNTFEHFKDPHVFYFTQSFKSGEGMFPTDPSQFVSTCKGQLSEIGPGKSKFNSSASKHVYNIVLCDKTWIYSCKPKQNNNKLFGCLQMTLDQQKLFVQGILPRKWLLLFLHQIWVYCNHSIVGS